MRPNVDQFDRDALDDLGLIDTGMAGDNETAPETRTLARPAGADQNTPTTR